MSLTLLLVGSKIYVKWLEAFNAPPIISENEVIFCSKNDKTILPYIFEDLTEGLEPMRRPQPPKKPTF